MPNTLATLVLLLWPFVVWRLFLRLPPGRALIWSLLGAYLLLPPLPAEIDFPLLPSINKSSLPSLAALAMAYLFAPQRPKLLPETPMARRLLIVFILSPIATVFTNSEPLVFTTNFIPGMAFQDAISQPINRFFIVIGFLLARNYLTTREDQRDFLIAMLVAGLAYSIPTLLEVRLSPQLNNWVYGYYQHLFSQTIRSGGYRPMVFLYHGIWLAFFMLTCLLSALALWKAEPQQMRSKYMIAAFYLGVILVLCKTLAVLVYALAIAPLMLLLRTRSQLRIAVLLTVLAVGYPIFKSLDLVPARAILAQAEAISPERSQSLAFRFHNEDILSERAELKPVFGWGTWGRNQLHDPDTGEITSVSDGYWIILLGSWGWVGFLAQFVLMSLPIWLLLKELNWLRKAERRAFKRGMTFSLKGIKNSQFAKPLEHSPYIGPLALMLGFNLVDLLPNATLTPMTWLISGMLLGHAEQLARDRRAAERISASSSGSSAPTADAEPQLRT